MPPPSVPQAPSWEPSVQVKVPTTVGIAVPVSGIAVMVTGTASSDSGTHFQFSRVMSAT